MKKPGGRCSRILPFCVFFGITDYEGNLSGDDLVFASDVPAVGINVRDIICGCEVLSIKALGCNGDGGICSALQTILLRIFRIPDFSINTKAT
ncbi:MAG: hypothetical protein B1H13_00005 [Desulfobacteraceae bacterium 4484_190.3]|nr:MAG: hypothetical protein B1H13_00005 [Desulfobacteraceae bacterium 4484_190.3]